MVRNLGQHLAFRGNSLGHATALGYPRFLKGTRKSPIHFNDMPRGVPPKPIGPCTIAVIRCNKPHLTAASVLYGSTQDLPRNPPGLQHARPGDIYAIGSDADEP